MLATVRAIDCVMCLAGCIGNPDQQRLLCAEAAGPDLIQYLADAYSLGKWWLGGRDSIIVLLLRRHVLCFIALPQPRKHAAKPD